MVSKRQILKSVTLLCCTSVLLTLNSTGSHNVSRRDIDEGGVVRTNTHRTADVVPNIRTNIGKIIYSLDFQKGIDHAAINLLVFSLVNTASIGAMNITRKTNFNPNYYCLSIFARQPDLQIRTYLYRFFTCLTYDARTKL